ncbi:aldo/keto reductase [Pseudomonas sp. KHPS1]|uniref:Aldo/keto reductase n=1 Tax=Ectopseudomonas oleovorans TaxID=301 RepID=A0AB35KX77_ECTOL|nr:MULTISPECIES: aldo/keto reductase [Pseudomonas]ATH83132.1 aldo/keto reductase [Pseudomonas mendocina]MCR1827041.1 aldo/keto reductase [Pseudomonas oleovorans]MDH0567017.1 aldo/keto reductase [Pseudomonas oleovorans]UTH37867.1 aldo/keto reductase [Pseudomonas sp. KHPS1]
MTAFPIRQPLLLGMMRLLECAELDTPQALLGFIERSVERGLNGFDHADIYGLGECEARFGAALRLRPQLRAQLQLISKADIVPAAQDVSRWRVKHYNTAASYLTQAVDASLQRLGVERLDGFLLHRPDPLLQVEEVTRALQALVAAGKVGWLGLSNAEPLHWQVLGRELELRCNQIELSLSAQQAAWDGRLQALQADGMQVLAWSPLAGGCFAPALQQALEEVAAALQATPLQVALAWLRRLPGRPVPILGSLREARIEEALAGAELQLDAPTWFYLSEAARGQRAP